METRIVDASTIEAVIEEEYGRILAGGHR